MEKSAMRALLASAKRTRVAWADGWPVEVAIPVAVIPPEAKAERRVRWVQHTDTDVRPKPGKSPNAAAGRYAIEAKRAHFMRNIGKIERMQDGRDDELDLSEAKLGQALLIVRHFCPHGNDRGICPVCDA